MWFLLIAQLTVFKASPPDPALILSGAWESCMEDDGFRAERIYDHFELKDGVNRPIFELHFGPGSEFAVFKGVQDAHREHGTKANILFPDYLAGNLEHPETKVWKFKVDGEKFQLTVRDAGGSSDSCTHGSDYPEYSYWFELRHIQK